LTDKLVSDKLEKAGDIKYYAIVNVPQNSLSASLWDNVADKKASIAASFNRIPTYMGGKWSADLSTCNIEFCPKVQVLSTKGYSPSQQFGAAMNGTWYVAVAAGRDSNDYTFWFDNVCPNNCSGSNGNCQTGSDNYGVCACNQNFEGLSCKQGSNQFIEYIILIIIAALVLVSALLGLIAWAYMRRRAQYVEVRWEINNRW